MISAISGILESVEEDRIELRAGAMVYELLVPAADVGALRARSGQDVTFHTVFYIGGDPTRGGLEPTLLGFLRREDRQFFEIFTTVKGIGPKTALKALTVAVSDVARAIEEKDARFLVGLPGIGKRTAELIIAELSGKVARFAIGPVTRGKAAPPTRRTPDEEDAVAALVALGERRGDAETLLDRARQVNQKLKSTNELVVEMLRLRSTR